jgi:hypothetical protein
MTQNINLFDSGLRKPRPRVSFAALLAGLAASAVALTVIVVFIQFQLNGLKSESRRLQAALAAEQAEALKRTGQAAAQKPDPRLEAEINKLRGEVKQAHDAIAALKGGSFGDQQGFAAYLGAFSRQSFEGVWLTGFTIAGGGELEIRGRALRPDLVPAYIQRLNREELLAGRSFARFEMNRPASQAAPFLEFSLATRDAGKSTEKSP